MLQETLAFPERLISHARLLAELHADMHGRAASSLTSTETRLRHKIQRAGPLPDAWKRAVLVRLDDLPGGNAICHGDFHPDNVVMTAGGPVIIDWVDVTMGAPLADVSRTILLARQGTAPPATDATMSEKLEALRYQFLESYLARYGELRPYDAAELAAWELPNAAARLEEGVVEEEEALLTIVKKELDG
jgi:aminoglycoside phosphotransferase (APT) family kinase protein